MQVVKLLGTPISINLSGGINPRGEYNPLTTYNTSDSVSFNGSSYIAIQETTGNLPTDTNFWQVLVEKLQDSFETISKNLKTWDYELQYTAGVLTKIIYTNGVDSIEKTLNYTSGVLTSIVLSGDTPVGISLTKTLTYSAGQLTQVSYS